MAEEQAQHHHGDEEDELTPGYKPPAEKSLKEIQELDQNDEALKKYKESLGVGASDVPIPCELLVNESFKATSFLFFFRHKS